MKKLYFLILVLCSVCGAEAQNIIFQNLDFKHVLRNAYGVDSNNETSPVDLNADGEIQLSEALRIRHLEIPYANLTEIQEISYFTNLLTLDCSNQLLSSLDVSSLANLRTLYCHKNRLTVLNVGSLAYLSKLICYDNQLPSLDLNGISSLKIVHCYNNLLTSLRVNFAPSETFSDGQQLYCYNNRLTSLSCNGGVEWLICKNNLLSTLDVTTVRGCLKKLDCSDNQLASLNITNMGRLTELKCQNNRLTSLDFSGDSSAFNYLSSLSCRNNQLTALNLNRLINISFIDCSLNQLSSIDVSNIGENFSFLECGANPLISMFLKKQGFPSSLNFGSCPNLRFICAKEADIAAVQQKINTYGYTNCTVNSYCSFTPEGTFYTLQGESKSSISNDCTVSGNPLPFVKFVTSSGRTIIADDRGNYSIPFQAGTYTITPYLDGNVNNFIITPASLNNITFPAATNPYIRNFCISPNNNNVSNDLEVVILPIVPARPGFNAKYKVIYKNKGNTTQSGTVNFTFNNTVLNLVSAYPSFNNQTLNTLSWDFSNLLPFENREIYITLNVNSPSDTPSVNIGDLFYFNSQINSALTDSSLSDNAFNFTQIVVGSFDPNDKTCLEGSAIPPSEVGKYVHYMIRFENTGTYPAQNIVVKDIIDTSKFNINTLVPMKGSHSFVTNITSGNKVEFIFENINLPFDDANNDGYVAFKIKTKPTLVVGNTFSNNASIYFDYNFPIVTNTATTAIQTLSTQDFSFSSFFMMYPNPVKDVLTIETKQTIEVSSINIYNQLGQMVLVVPNAQNVSKVDVSSLASGNYFIKINSDKGTSNTKFIKQ